MLVITLFWQVLDNNSLKALLQQLLSHLQAVFSRYPHERVQHSTIRLIKAHLSYLKYHAPNVPLISFSKFHTISDKILWEI